MGRSKGRSRQRRHGMGKTTQSVKRNHRCRCRFQNARCDSRWRELLTSRGLIARILRDATRKRPIRPPWYLEDNISTAADATAALYPPSRRCGATPPCARNGACSYWPGLSQPYPEHLGSEAESPRVVLLRVSAHCFGIPSTEVCTVELPGRPTSPGTIRQANKQFRPPPVRPSGSPQRCSRQMEKTPDATQCRRVGGNPHLCPNQVPGQASLFSSPFRAVKPIPSIRLVSGSKKNAALSRLNVKCATVPSALPGSTGD